MEPSGRNPTTKEVPDATPQRPANVIEGPEGGVLARMLQSVQGRLAHAQPLRHSGLSELRVSSKPLKYLRELPAEIHADNAHGRGYSHAHNPRSGRDQSAARLRGRSGWPLPGPLAAGGRLARRGPVGGSFDRVGLVDLLPQPQLPPRPSWSTVGPVCHKFGSHSSLQTRRSEIWHVLTSQGAQDN